MREIFKLRRKGTEKSKVKKPKARPIVLLSHLSDDQEFGRGLADHFGGSCEVITEREEAQRALVKKDDAIVLWNAESPNGYDRVCEVIGKFCAPRNVFAITSKNIRHYPELLEHPVFGYHLLRHYDGDGLETYFKLIEAVSLPQSFYFERFFSDRAQFRRLTIRNPAHKRLAADVVQRYFTQIGFMGRVAVAATQAIDELIMNAIFDAPLGPKGDRSRWGHDRHEEFELSVKERVEVVIGMDATYSGISICDRFGSLTRKTYNEAISKHYHRVSTSKDVSVLEPGIGLRRILNSHLSLLHYVEPGKHTQAMVFFSHSGTYKEFRKSCQFVGMLDRE